MQGDNGKSDFKRYPQMLRALIKSAQKFLDTHPNCSTLRKFGNVYNLVFNDLFCDSYDDYITKTSVDLWGGATGH